jgi:hypothetical protein
VLDAAAAAHPRVLVAGSDSQARVYFSAWTHGDRGEAHAEPAAVAKRARGEGSAPAERDGAVRGVVVAAEDRVEAGWSGVALEAGAREAKGAVASFFGRLVALFDGERVTRRFHTALNPTELRFVAAPQGGSQLLVLCERNVVNVFDPRADRGAASVARFQPSGAPLLAAAASLDGTQLAFGGAERGVFVYDARKWGLAGAWTGATKYEITGLEFAVGDASLCFVVSLDHQVACGSVRETNVARLERQGPRSDSRWLGWCRCPASDTLLGFTEAGSLYRLRDALTLRDAPPAAGPDPGGAE